MVFYERAVGAVTYDGRLVMEKLPILQVVTFGFALFVIGTLLVHFLI